MLTRITYLLFICFAANISLEAQTYVNQSATGANDGTSWENAYTSIDSALAKTDSGEILLVGGTYRHDGDSTGVYRTYYVKSPVGIYGGFAGTEASLDERDVAANPTILTADWNGDDIEGRLDTLKSDNSYHIVTVDSLITSPVTFDGLHFTGGATTLNGDLGQYDRRGAGIYAWSTINVNNCTFTGNLARGATCIFLDPAKAGGSGSNITNNVFSGNYADNRGAGIYFFNQTDILIEGNEFSGNTTARGVVYPFRSENIMIRNNKFLNNSGSYSDGFCSGVFMFRCFGVTVEDCEFTGNTAGSSAALYCDLDSTHADFDDNLLVKNCTFTDNQAMGGSGGAMFIWQATGITMENTTFANNSSTNLGGVMYQDGRDQVIKEDNLVFKNCTFMGNSSPNSGGAISTWQSSTSFYDCVWDGNSSTDGAAMFSGGSRGKFVKVMNSEVLNSSSSGFGVMNLYGGDAIFTVDSCEFKDNSAGSSGGAIITGFIAETNISNTLFDGNTSDGGGGAIRMQNDGTILNLSNNVFTENISMGNGGAVLTTQGSHTMVDDCEFTGNGAESGGAIASFEDTTVASLVINNTIMQFNSASTQGGALNIVGPDTEITNSVLNNNFNLNGISGGAISGNSSGVDDTVVIKVVNSTIAGNEGPVGAGVGLWTDGELGSTTLYTQNSIFANEGANYAIEEGTPNVVSMGGNLSSDASFAGQFNEDLDLEEVTDALFIGPDDSDFHLLAGSPAINIGVEPAPTTDIEGLERVGPPDAGAYESQFDVSVKDILVANNNQLKILPNPVLSDLNILIENDMKGALSARLFNVHGQLVQTWNFTKVSSKSNEQFDVAGLPNGLYDLVVGNEEKVVAAKVVKQ